MMIASAAGESSAAPRPWPARAANRVVAEPAMADANDDALKIAEAGQEHAPTAEQIGSPAAEEEQASEDERVAGDGPADVGAAELEVSREARQRDVHGRDVEDDHQLGDQQDDQENTTALAGSADCGMPRCGCRMRRRVVVWTRSCGAIAWCGSVPSLPAPSAGVRGTRPRSHSGGRPGMRLARRCGVADHTACRSASRSRVGAYTAAACGPPSRSAVRRRV